MCVGQSFDVNAFNIRLVEIEAALRKLLKFSIGCVKDVEPARQNPRATYKSKKSSRWTRIQ
jgi:hypothetical protein